MGGSEQGLRNGADRYAIVPRTLCFVRHEDAILLLKGSPTKRLWPNLYNGVGGHIERDEDIYAAARREIREEAGLEVEALSLRAVLHVSPPAEEMGILVFVFAAESRTRRTVPSSEGALEWVPRDRLLELDLVEGLRVLLPRLFARSPQQPVLGALYTYDHNDQLITHFSHER